MLTRYLIIKLQNRKKYYCRKTINCLLLPESVTWMHYKYISLLSNNHLHVCSLALVQLVHVCSFWNKTFFYTVLGQAIRNYYIWILQLQFW